MLLSQLIVPLSQVLLVHIELAFDRLVVNFAFLLTFVAAVVVSTKILLLEVLSRIDKVCSSNGLIFQSVLLSVWTLAIDVSVNMLPEIFLTLRCHQGSRLLSSLRQTGSDIFLTVVTFGFTDSRITFLNFLGKRFYFSLEVMVPHLQFVLIQ